jgi:hypothetical protein
MPEEEVRFKQIAATTWSTGHVNSPSQVRLFGLTEEGVLYEWMEQKRGWGQYPMKKLPESV